MGYERYPDNTNPQGDYYGRRDPQDYGQDYGSGREGSYSSARDYQAAGQMGPDRDRGSNRGDRDRDPRPDRSQERGFDARGGGYYQPQDRGATDPGRDRNRQRDRMGGSGRGSYGRQPQGYDYQDRGFFNRAGDEVRSWFGDEDAERRREADMRYDDRGEGGRTERDSHYHDWRRGQMAALDRDYDEYRHENRAKFENEFATWRTERQGQRDSMRRVDEHMDVVGSDGTHVGTVDKVRGDRILLTKNDADAGGHHHSIPSRWIKMVDDKVTLAKTAQEAKDHWRDEERNLAMFGHDDPATARTPGDRQQGSQARDSQGRMLDRSFSGTY